MEIVVDANSEAFTKVLLQFPMQRDLSVVGINQRLNNTHFIAKLFSFLLN